MNNSIHKSRLLIIGIGVTLAMSIALKNSAHADDNQAYALDQCIGIALKQQPNIRASTTMTEVNKEILTQARSEWYPWISAQGSYARETNNYVFPPAFSHLLPSKPSMEANNTSYDYYNASIGFTWLLTNFGQRLYTIRAQQQAVKSAQYNEETTKSDVILNVIQGYYGLLASQHISDVAAEVVSESSRHLEQANGFLSVGRVSRIDTARAETDYANAQLNMITAKNNVELAMVNLLNAMGIKETDTISILDTMTPTTRDYDLNEVIQKAMDNRPELKSLYAADESIRASQKATMASNLPSIIGSGGYNWTGYNTPLTWNWSIGVGVQFPLFSGFSTYGRYGELKAREDNLQAQIDAAKQGITFQAKQAYLNLQQAKDSINAAKKAMDSAKLNLELADGRYTTGAGSIIELTDAETLFASTSAVYIQSVYSYNIALSMLRRAEGSITEGY